MKPWLFIVMLLLWSRSGAQNEALAKQYFEEGAFEKAVLYYEALYQKYPHRSDYVYYLVGCYQQLERYKDAERLLLSKIEQAPVYQTSQLRVELGYNYSLQQKKQEAEACYQEALKALHSDPTYAYMVGEAFRKKSLLQHAITAFQKGIAAATDYPFNLYYGLASVHGEMGDLEAMYHTYLDLVERQANAIDLVKRRLGEYITEDSESASNTSLKKALLKRVQTQDNVLWNQLLSWLFIQQKQYKNAFIQEKALYKRSSDEDPLPVLEKIMELGVLARENEDAETAREVFTFVVNTVEDNQSEAVSLKMQGQLSLLEMEIENAQANDLQRIEDIFVSLLKTYGYQPDTLPLQIAYARFLTFQRNESAKGIALLTQALKLPLSALEEAQTRLELADMLVYEEKFNQALIYYTQVQKSLKNNPLAQTASFKIAQTSFYKGDFAWAETQLDVLKSSTSQLIANDALELKLLISDNKTSDSTQTALKQYAKAHLLAYQNKDGQAMEVLQALLKQYPGDPIEDQALLKQAQLLEKKGTWNKAEQNYLKIAEAYPYEVLADDALYALAELYKNHLNAPEKAKTYYEKIILNHPDSVYFVASRNAYRKLRGDVIQ